MDSTIKGLSESSEKFDGSTLRIAIVHTRWNTQIVQALVAGAVDKLKAQGVQESNIVIQSVPGCYELPFACSKVIAGSRVPVSTNETDLLGGINFASSKPQSPAIGNETPAIAIPAANEPFDAVIAIGCLIKGSTMHFEYICDAVSHGLMKLQMDSGVPVIFGVLTCLTDDQALDRAGIGRGLSGKGHNHGEDWGMAAVEMASRCKRWAVGRFD